MKPIYQKLALCLAALFFTLALEAHAADKADKIDLQKQVERLSGEVNDPNLFNSQTCSKFLDGIYQQMFVIDPATFDVNKLRGEWRETTKSIWTLRHRLRNRLAQMDAQGRCISSARNAFRLARYVEDYLIEVFAPNSPEDLQIFSGAAPITMLADSNETPLRLRSGDIIISRGNAFASAAIARIAEVDSQFSHLALIYIDDTKGETLSFTIEEALHDPRVLVLESHIEVGSTIRKFSEYAADRNARNAIFRMKGLSPENAHQAARAAYDYIVDYRLTSRSKSKRLKADDVNHNVPYDFQMKLGDRGESFCSEIAHIAYQSIDVEIPQHMSALNSRLDLARRLMIKEAKIFAPGDIEFDFRFNFIAEYRDPTRLRGVRHKDMVLSSMFKWMADGYRFYPSPLTRAQAAIAWSLRQLDASSVKTQLPKNMGVGIIETIMTLDDVALVLERDLIAREVQYKATNSGLPLPFRDGLDWLQQLKERDRATFLEGRRPVFHWEFRSPSDHVTIPPDGA